MLVSGENDQSALTKNLAKHYPITVPFLNRLLSAWRDKVALGDPDNGYFFYHLAIDINKALKSENSTTSQADEVTFEKFLWYILYQKKHNKLVVLFCSQHKIAVKFNLCNSTRFSQSTLLKYTT